MALKFLGTEKDKNGREVQFYHNEELTMSPVYPLFLRGIAELISSNMRETYKSWEDDECGSIHAQIDNEIVGHIVYSKENNKVLVIAEASVDKEHQGLGIYTHLYNHLEQIAKDMGCWAVSISIHVDNLEAIRISSKLGMTSSFYKMMKKL
jgi:GNAT superfamily N-acetyltransferase